MKVVAFHFLTNADLSLKLLFYLFAHVKLVKYFVWQSFMRMLIGNVDSTAIYISAHTIEK